MEQKLINYKDINSNEKQCALCKKKKKMTFEHIPPRAAFNSFPAKPVMGDRILGNNGRPPWDLTGLPFSNQQRGMGKESLCAECNNNTGAWYAKEYIRFANTIHEMLRNEEHVNWDTLELEGAYPLKIIKQVLSMFCSINEIDDDRFDYLREFVLDKRKVGIDRKKIKIYIYFIKSKLVKYNSLSVKLNLNNPNLYKIISEITAYPLGFILYLDPKNGDKHEGIDITNFCDCEFDTKYKIVMPICIKDMNDIIPEYYRTKDEVLECIEENRVVK